MNRLPLLRQIYTPKTYLVLFETFTVKKKDFNINLEDEIIKKP